MIKIIRVLRTTFFYLMFLVGIFVGLVPCFLLSLFSEKYRFSKLYYFFMALFYRVCWLGTLLPVTVVGRERLLSTEPTIVVANHQSALDIILVGKLFKLFPHLWLFKSELVDIPLYGYMTKRMNIAIDRSTPRKALQGILNAINLTKDKRRSLAIFPEGGRFNDGKVHDFLLGFAIIARKTGRPVVPVAIINANKAYPTGSLQLHYAPIKLVVGKPYVMYEGETDEQFCVRVRSWFVEQLEG